MRLIAAICIIATSAPGAFFGSLVPATTYYVDQASGNDSNNGTSTATAFATIAKLQSVLTAAHSGAIYGGSSSQLRYNEELSIPAANVAVVGWGKFAPDLNCSDPITAGDWTKTGGFTNIYQTTVVTVNALGFLRLWQKTPAASFPRAASLAALDSAPGSYFVSGDPDGGGSTSFTMYVNTLDSSNPSTNGKIYEFNKRSQGLFSNFTGTVASNLQMERNLGNNGSFECGPNCLATDITANDGTKHNSLMHGGSTYRNLSMTDSYYAGQPKIASVLNDDSPSGQTGTWISPTYTENFETTGEGFFGHINVSGIFGQVTIINGITVRAAQSIGGFVSTDMLIQGGNYNAGIATGSPNSNILRNLTVGGQIILPFTAPLELDTVTVTGAFTNGAVRIGTGASITPSINIHDSAFSNSTAFDGSIWFNSGVFPASFTSQRNIFLAPAQVNHYEGAGTDNIPLGSIFAHNEYHYPTAGIAFIVFRGTNYNISDNTQWAAWQVIEPTATRVTP